MVMLSNSSPSSPPPPPQYSLDAIAGQKAITAVQGSQGTFFCGAWMGYGFHEDG
jgi:predicted NAD/FAD-binding protein